MITSKSENIKNVPDEFFDKVEEGMSLSSDKYFGVQNELLSEMKCKKCGGKIGYYCVGWGDDCIQFRGLHCNDCDKRYGITGCRMFNIDKTEITGLSWFIPFIVAEVLDS